MSTEFERVLQEVHSMLPELAIVLEGTLNCNQSNNYSTSTYSEKIGTVRMRALHTYGVIDFIEFGPCSPNHFTARSTELCTYNVVSEQIAIYSSNNLYGTLKYTVFLDDDNSDEEPLDLDEFLNVDKEKFFNLMVQYPLTELNLKYIMGYAILLNNGKHYIPEQKSVGFCPSNIELIGLSTVAQSIKEYNENKNSKNF